MAGLTAGDLDRRITIRTAQPVTSESGETVMDWAHAVETTIWAQWLPGSTREAYLAQRQLGSYIEGVYRIYHGAEFLADRTRIIGHDGRTYDTKPLVEMGRGDGWLVPVIARGEQP